MPFDDPSVPADSGRRLSIVPCREGWAIKHGDGFLGVSADREEALRLLQALDEATDWRTGRVTPPGHASVR